MAVIQLFLFDRKFLSPRCIFDGFLFCRLDRSLNGLDPLKFLFLLESPGVKIDSDLGVLLPQGFEFAGESLYICRNKSLVLQKSCCFDTHTLKN